MYAPIVVFAYSRLEPLKKCVDSLLENSEAAETGLIVYVDRLRANKVGEVVKVAAMRENVKTITGFKSVSNRFSEVEQEANTK